MGPMAGLDGCGKSRTHGNSVVILMNLINDLRGSRCSRSLLVNVETKIHNGADNSLAQPGREQATVTEDFDFHISYL